MNQEQVHELEMFEAINDYLNKHADIWSTVPIIGNYKNQLSIIISHIHKFTSNSTKPNGALRTLKLQLADKMDILDDVMEAYATDIGDEKLRVLSANSHADYVSLSTDKFELKVRQVIALLERHVAEMSDYGINSEQIEDAKLCFNDYLRQVGKPYSYPIDSRIVAQDLVGLFKEANIYLNKLDNVMQRFKRSSIQFFLGYQSARRIIPF